MFKFSKADLQALNDAISEADEKTSEIEAAVEKFNAEMVELFTEVETIVDERNAAVATARDIMSAAIETWREEWEDKSEKWQEGDRGSAILQWIEEWEQFAEQLKEEKIEPPEAVEMPELSELANDVPTEEAEV